MNFKDIVRAVALGHTDTAKAGYEALPDADKPKYHEYLTTAFALMLAVRLESDQSRAEIDRFIGEVKHAYRDVGDKLKPLALEATVRATMGEEELISEVSPGDQLSVQVLCIRFITETVPKVRDNLDAYLTDAETLAAAELD